MMEYSIKAHPTMYQGVRYRSRLEARWAALFTSPDNFEAEYEPLDLNGWTPDFLITSKNSPWYLQFDNFNRPYVSKEGPLLRFLAEVKPYMHVSQFSNHLCYEPQEPEVWAKNNIDGIVLLGAHFMVTKLIPLGWHCLWNSVHHLQLWDCWGPPFDPKSYDNRPSDDYADYEYFYRGLETAWNDAGNQTKYRKK